MGILEKNMKAFVSENISFRGDWNFQIHAECFTIWTTRARYFFPHFYLNPDSGDIHILHPGQG